MPTTSCPPTDDLTRLLAGDLSAATFQRISTHVDGCADCQSHLTRLADQSDALSRQYRRAAGSSDPPTSPDAVFALERLRQAFRERAAFGRETAPQPLTQLGPYRLDSLLGWGGMGAVYRATHTRLKRQVALKVLPADRWNDFAAIQRFEREMEAIGQLQHPHIVLATDAGEEQGWHYLAMEYVDGLDLSKLANRLGLIPLPDLCEIGHQAALGLAWVHQRGLIHRDIKPSNLMLAWDPTHNPTSDASPSAHVKILDLGLAIMSFPEMGRVDQVTTIGQIMGTLDYMAPEQGMASHLVDARSDLYSLGATLFRLLTGVPPYGDGTQRSLLQKVTALATQPAHSVLELKPDTPPPVAAIIDRLLARDAEQRFGSALELAEALGAWTHGCDLSQLLGQGLAAMDQDPPPSPAVMSRIFPQYIFPLSSRSPAGPAMEPSRSKSIVPPWITGLAFALLGLISVTAMVYYWKSAETPVATIPAPIDSTASASAVPIDAKVSDGPLYEGKTLSQCLHDLKQQASPADLKAALDAIHAMLMHPANRPNTPDAARAVLQLMSHYGTYDPKSPFWEIGQSAASLLHDLDPTLIAEPVAEALREMNLRSDDFLQNKITADPQALYSSPDVIRAFVYRLENGSTEQQIRIEKWALQHDSYLRRSSEILEPVLIKRLREQTDFDRKLQTALILARAVPNCEGLADWLRTALEHDLGKDYEHDLQLLRFVLAHRWQQPHTEAIAACLVRYLSHTQNVDPLSHNRLELTMEALGSLGPAAKAAIPCLEPFLSDRELARKAEASITMIDECALIGIVRQFDQILDRVPIAKWADRIAQELPNPSPRWTQFLDWLLMSCDVTDFRGNAHLVGTPNKKPTQLITYLVDHGLIDKLIVECERETVEHQQWASNYLLRLCSVKNLSVTAPAIRAALKRNAELSESTVALLDAFGDDSENRLALLIAHLKELNSATQLPSASSVLVTLMLAEPWRDNADVQSELIALREKGIKDSLSSLRLMNLTPLVPNP